MPRRSTTIFKEYAHLDSMAQNAKPASELLKAVAHENRLMIMCCLAHGEKSVNELEEMLSIQQPTVSQHLKRLRADDLIEARRDGKSIFYSIQDERARKGIELVYELFCGSDVNK